MTSNPAAPVPHAFMMKQRLNASMENLKYSTLCHEIESNELVFTLSTSLLCCEIDLIGKDTGVCRLLAITLICEAFS